MTKHLRFLIVLLLTLVWSAGWAAESVYKTLSFPDDNNANNQQQNYTSTWIAKIGSDSWSIVNFNNNKWGNSWKYIKCGREKQASVATITNSNAFDKPITKVVVNASKIADLTKVKSIKLETSKVADFSSIAETVTLTSIAVGYLKFDITNPIENGFYRLTFDCLNKKNGLVQVDQVDYYIDASKADTNVSFGTNSNKTFTFTEGKLEGFTAPTATETNNVAGTITYSSDNEFAVKVNASTGALSFPGYGDAKITATFTPTDAKKYAVSTDSYKVKNERGVVAGTITFDKANGAFENVDGSGYNSSDYTFVSDSNESFTFKCTDVNKQNECLQLRGNTGKVESPTFTQFTNGYKVYVVYSSKSALTLKAGEYKATGTTTTSVTNDGAGADVSIEVPANESFVINVGSGYAKISKIEIIPNKVDEKENITLNESADNNTIESKTGVNVTLMRTMKAGVWNTICLPFDVSEDKAKTVFGAGVKIAVLDTKSTDKTLKFYDYTTLGIPAATPCLIKPSEVKTSNEYVFENVKIVADELTYDTTNGNLAFRGIYNMVDVTTDVKKIGDDYYAAFLGANNTIFKANGGKMKGFRAYFAIPKDTAASALRVVIDGTATSIKNIDSEVVESNAPVYNLQGQRVDGNNLTPGIYVKAGKKFVVK